MNFHTIIRAALVPFVSALLGIILIVGTPALAPAQAASPPPPTACRASVKVPFSAVIGPEETPITATLLDPQDCVRHARYDLVEPEFHKTLGTLDFFPGQTSVTFTLEGPGTYRLVSDDAYNVRENADVTGLDPSFRDSNTLNARLASKVSAKVTHKGSRTYVTPRAYYWEPAVSKWQELIDLPIKVSRNVQGHWVSDGTTVSGVRERVTGAGPWRVKVPESLFIWGTTSTTRR